jgi:hypothetical protein
VAPSNAVFIAPQRPENEHGVARGDDEAFVVIDLTSEPSFRDAGNATPADLAPLQMAPVDVPAMEIAPADVPAMEMAPADVPAMEMAPVDVPAMEMAPVDVPAMEMAPADVPAMEMAPVDVPAMEMAPVDVSAMEMVSIDVAPLEMAPVGMLRKRRESEGDDDQWSDMDIAQQQPAVREVMLDTYYSFDEDADESSSPSAPQGAFMSMPLGSASTEPLQDLISAHNMPVALPRHSIVLDTFHSFQTQQSPPKTPRSDVAANFRSPPSVQDSRGRTPVHSSQESVPSLSLHRETQLAPILCDSVNDNTVFATQHSSSSTLRAQTQDKQTWSEELIYRPGESQVWST